ncbi:neuromedin S [Cricetulus griseus]
MKHLLPQFPSILIIYCFCLLQIPSSGVSQPFADSPDGLDIMGLEFAPVHPLMRLAAKLAGRRMKRLQYPVCARFLPL